MADRVTNEAVLVALRGLGINITGPLDMTGAQNTEWKQKILPLITAQLPKGQYADDIFNRAITTAKQIKDIPVDASPIDRLSMTLSAYGVKGDQYTQIINEAKRIKQADPSLRDRGTPFDVEDYAQAAANVLGHTGAVLDAFSNAGIKAPPAPAQGTPGSKVTPPGGAAPFPNNMGGGDIDPMPPPPAPVTKPTATGGSKGTGGAGTTGGTGRVGPPPPDPSKMDDVALEKYLRENYGANVWVLGIPEVKKIVFGALRNPSGVTQDILTSEITKTEWWGKNGLHVAEFLQKQATAGRQLNDSILGRQRQLTERAAVYGLNLSPEKNLELATDWEKWQWDDDAVESALAGQFHYEEGQHSVFIDKLTTDAKNYLIPIGKDTIETWGRRIIEGGESENGNWQNFLKEQAKSMFPAWASRLDAGETMTAIASPYAQMAAQTLEIEEKDVDFMNPKWMAALDTVDDKGNHSSMSYADWTRKLRTDGQYRYDYTEGAKQAATGMATDLLKKFGQI